MTDQLEHHQRGTFAEDAARLRAGDDLRGGAMCKVRRRRRVRLPVAAGASIVVATGIAVLASLLPDSGNGTGRLTNRPTPTSFVGTSRGALPDGSQASCAAQYTTKTLAGMAFAFDGTITAIGPAHTNNGSGDLPLVSASFNVHLWFRGGSGSTVTVDIAPPHSSEDGPPSYAVGTRLLVSGQPRWGGAPLDDPIAWGCGFTRYYDTTTADTWRAAFD